MTEFSLKEQLDFVDTTIVTYELVAQAFENASEEVKADCRRDVELMKAVRRTIRFEYLMEQMAKKHSPELEELPC